MREFDRWVIDVLFTRPEFEAKSSRMVIISFQDEILETTGVCPERLSHLFQTIRLGLKQAYPGEPVPILSAISGRSPDAFRVIEGVTSEFCTDGKGAVCFLSIAKPANYHGKEWSRRLAALVAYRQDNPVLMLDADLVIEPNFVEKYFGALDAG